MGYNLIILFVLFIVIILNNYFLHDNYMNEIFIKKFRRHPWLNSFKKYSNNLVKIKSKSNFEYSNTITSIITSKILYDLGNKDTLSLFLKNKAYYPKTYIYNKYNKTLPIIENNDTWFIKPIKAYGGKGINVINKNEALKKNLYKNCIIQKGITNLYLFNNHKGDFRVYYLVTFYNDTFSFYLYKDGLIKLAKNKYRNYSLNKGILITNTSQIKEKERPRSMLFDEKIKDYNILFNKIRILLTDLSKDIANKSHNHKSNYFLEYQLCGPDIIFDNKFNPYLFEMNSKHPAYVMKKNIPEVKIMKRNISKILVDKLFIPAINKKKIELENYGFVKLL